jgi:hypothetical protein
MLELEKRVNRDRCMVNQANAAHARWQLPGDEQRSRLDAPRKGDRAAAAKNRQRLTEREKEETEEEEYRTLCCGCWLSGMCRGATRLQPVKVGQWRCARPKRMTIEENR